MKRYGMILFVSAIAVFLAACSRPPKNLFVLLPNADGTAGEITVANQSGTQVLSQPGHAIPVEHPTTAPGTPLPIPEQEIARLFGKAMAAHPEPPAHFMLYFESGTARLTEDSEKLLPEILRAIERRRSNDVGVIGHTDRVGSREPNYQLGMDRAVEVKSLLMSRGVDPGFIRVNSLGQDNPLIPTRDEVPEPRNRRVDVTVR